jgi:nucleoside recognition membrane protein YjiH
MTTAIVVSVVALFGIALVASQLARMKEWLKNSPPLPPPIEFDDERDDKP